MPSLRFFAAPAGNFLALLFEGAHPIGHFPRLNVTLLGNPVREPGHLEEISDLYVGQLDQQIRQKPAARLADDWIVQRATERSRKVGDAAGAALPHRRDGPAIQIHAAERVPIEDVDAAERQAEIGDEHERPHTQLTDAEPLLVTLRTVGRVLGRGIQTHQALLRRLVVAV